MIIAAIPLAIALWGAGAVAIDSTVEVGVTQVDVAPLTPPVDRIGDGSDVAETE